MFTRPFSSRPNVKEEKVWLRETKAQPPTAMKLAGGSQYTTSLLWASFLGSSQPCTWLTGQIEAQQSFKHNLLPQILGESHQTLQAFWPPKTMCPKRGHKVVFVYSC